MFVSTKTLAIMQCFPIPDPLSAEVEWRIQLGQGKRLGLLVRMVLTHRPAQFLSEVGADADSSLGGQAPYCPRNLLVQRQGDVCAYWISIPPCL